MRKFNYYIQKLSNIFLSLPLLIALLWIATNSFDILNKHFLNNDSIKIISIILAYVIIAIALMFVTSKIKYLHLSLLSVIVFSSSLLKLWWINNTKTIPESDFILLYKTSTKLLNGNTNVIKNSEYYDSWPYQTGFTIWQKTIGGIFGNNVRTLNYVNVVISAISIILVYLIVKQLFNSNTGLSASFLYAFLMPTIFASSILTNQIPAIMFYLLSFYLIIIGKNKLHEDWNYLWLLILAGFSLALGNILRPLAPIILIAIILYFIVYEINFEPRNIIKPLVAILIIFSAYSTQMFFANRGIIDSGISDYKLINRDPSWKFITGLDYKSKGTYSREKLTKLQEEPIGEKRNKLGKKMIKQELHHPKLLNLFAEKFKIMWSKSDSLLAFSVNNKKANIHSKKQIKWLNKLQDYQWFSIIVLSIIGPLFAILGELESFKNKNIYLINKEAMFFSIILIGYLLVHFVIEIQTRYRFFALPLFIVLASQSIFIIKKSFVDDEKSA